MQLTLSQAALADVDVDLLVVPLYGERIDQHPTFQELDAALDGELARIATQQAALRGKVRVLSLHTFGKIAARVLRIVALDGAVTTDALRLAAVEAARAAAELETVAVLTPSTEPSHLRALAEGLSLGNYRYSEYLTGPRKPKPGPRGVLVLRSRPGATERAELEAAGAASDAVNFARDLVNAPPNEKTASGLAAAARRIARDEGIQCSVWGKEKIAKHGMSLLLAVNAGSTEEPRFIHLAYVPKNKHKLPRLVFVGKGLTFDAGGLTIKGGKSMETMKSDMAGGAVTIAIVMAAARLGLAVEVHGIVPCTDNMLGGQAFKPGDVYRSVDGKTVEVLDTDAEGRLILADALIYARKLKPTVLIDHGTLTGDSMAALGRWRAALYATDETLSDRYLEAAKRSGEAFWPLPLDDQLKPTIESPIADLKNTGDGTGGSIAAALFLREFVADADWIHLDIAGPAFLFEPHDVSPKGGTGFGVRTALEFIRSYAS